MKRIAWIKSSALIVGLVALAFSAFGCGGSGGRAYLSSHDLEPVETAASDLRTKAINCLGRELGGSGALETEGTSTVDDVTTLITVYQKNPNAFDNPPVKGEHGKVFKSESMRLILDKAIENLDDCHETAEAGRLRQATVSTK